MLPYLKETRKAIKCYVRKSNFLLDGTLNKDIAKKEHELGIFIIWSNTNASRYRGSRLSIFKNFKAKQDTTMS